MKKLIVLLVLSLTSLFQASLLSQQSLDIFKPLVDKVWYAEGTWGNGSSFKQEVEFSFDLGGQLVIAQSQGFTNMEQTEYGPRNHGIRRYDAETQQILFVEYDVFGGVTKGEVQGNERDIIYTYDYGGTMVTDYWQYVDEDNYNFTVGMMKDGKWQQKLLETRFVRKNK